MRLPDDVRTLVRTQDPTRPRLTWYGEQPGERVELSGRVLDNWAAKAGNLLQEELDVGPGNVVQLDLPAGHWRSMYWALATWSVGATLEIVDTLPAAPADVVVTARPPAALHCGGSAQVIAVSLEALARRATWPLDPGDIDEAAQLSSYGDVLDPWDRPSPGAPALRGSCGPWSFDAIVAPAPDRVRAQLPVTAPAGVLLRAALSVWGADGSIVITPARPASELEHLAGVEGAQLSDPDSFAGS